MDVTLVDNHQCHHTYRVKPIVSEIVNFRNSYRLLMSDDRKLSLSDLGQFMIHVIWY